MTFAIIDVSF